MFRITEGKGFQVTFENGITISVQIGRYNYCDNQIDYSSPLEGGKLDSSPSCENAEIAVWDKDGNWILSKFTDKENDEMVMGWLSVEEVFEIIDRIRNYN